MKHLLLTTIAAVLLVGCGPSMSIHEATEAGNIEVVELHLAAGTDVDTKNENGFTPLHIAASKGYKEVAELLVTNDADVNTKDNGSTPLHMAAQFGHKAIVELLINKVADVNAKGELGETPLHSAAADGEKEIVELLIVAGADVNVRDKEGYNSLHRATYERHKNIVELLIAKGTDVNAKTNQGETPLDMAVYMAGVSGDNNKIADLLRKHGGKTIHLQYNSLHEAAEAGGIEEVKKLLDLGRDINLMDGTDKTGNVYHWTPLHFAAKEDHKEVAELLVAKGADVHIKDDEGNTPFDVANLASNLEIAKFLRKNGAKYGSIYSAAGGGDINAVMEFLASGLDSNIKTEIEIAGFKQQIGNSPLHYAAQSGHKKIAELLIAKGADVNARTWIDGTPLHFAARGGQKELAEFLISKGADVNAELNVADGATPLYFAANQEVAELLITKGGNINALGSFNQETPLHHAAEEGHKEVVELLIAKGANVNQRDVHYGRTPLFVAAYEGHTDIAELLIAKGADVNAKTYDDETSLDMAIDNGHDQIADLLRKHGGKTSEELKAEGK